MRFKLIFNILAISLVNQVICGNEGSRWIAADLAELKLAAAENDPYAKGFLALCHIHGDKGMNISMSDALTFARSSSDQNHWLGHFALGYLARFKPYGPDENLVSQFYLRTFQDPDAKMIKAYASGDPVASYAIAEIFSSDEVRPNLVPDLLFAAKHYQKASNGGYLPASVQFALFKLNAIVDPSGGVAEDVSYGIKLLRQATEKKLPVGYHYLGRSYFKGIGVEKDHEMALVNFRAAADRGYTISQLAVADFYAYGLTGQPKIDLAIRYAQLAMDQDEEKALAKIDEYQKLSQPTNADSIPSVPQIPSYENTPPLPPPPSPVVVQSSQPELPGSIPSPPLYQPSTRLPSVYEERESSPVVEVPQPPQVIENTQPQPIANPPPPPIAPIPQPLPLPGKSPSELRELAKAHYWGLGQAKDYTKAQELFRSASDKGDAESARYLGLIFLGGKGVARDPKKAIEWFSLGADRGDSLAAKNLKSLKEIY